MPNLMIDLYAELENRHSKAMNKPETTDSPELDETARGSLVMLAGKSDFEKTDICQRCIGKANIHAYDASSISFNR